MSPRKPPNPVMLSRSSFISMGLVCTLLSGAFNFGVTTMRNQAEHAQEERVEADHATRIAALEAAMVALKLEEATRLTKLEDGVAAVEKQLAHIDGRLSGVVSAKGKP